MSTSHVGKRMGVIELSILEVQKNHVKWHFDYAEHGVYGAQRVVLAAMINRDHDARRALAT